MSVSRASLPERDDQRQDEGAHLFDGASLNAVVPPAERPEALAEVEKPLGRRRQPGERARVLDADLDGRVVSERADVREDKVGQDGRVGRREGRHTFELRDGGRVGGGARQSGAARSAGRRRTKRRASLAW